MKLTYRHTLFCSYAGYITQAVINNLAPLLFLTFQREFAVSLDKIGLLISVNFSVQMLVDLLSSKWIGKIGYRAGITAAHALAVLGLLLLGTLPFVMSPYPGLLIATVFCAVGGGLIEVLISPIVESLPGEAKTSAMSLLHSFYCWGQVGVVLLSTLYFSCLGTERWRFLPLLWAVIPLVNFFFFCKVPLRTMEEEGGSVPLKKLFAAKVFWLLILFMLCAGASEMAMSQWSSLFAEAGLGVSKTLGDLLGPCAFAALMGFGRLLFGIFGEKINLKRALQCAGALCVVSYLITVFAPHPVLSLLGCALCGLGVAIMWPGLFSLASQTYPQGGTAMFALLALAGDVGCTFGPALVGAISSQAPPVFSGDAATAGLKLGLLISLLFPLVLALGLFALRKEKAVR